MNAVNLHIGLTVVGARRALTAAFRDEGLDSPELDARLLVGHALGLDHTGLIAAADHKLTAEEQDSITQFALRRLAHEPVARIRGYKEFWGSNLRITADVLVPRPETETIVEAALAALRPNLTDAALRIADLGTGSGAILIALLSELPNAYGVGTDMSPVALGVARTNADLHGLASRSAWVACDYGSALAGVCHLVVSNPPYIATGDLAELPADVRDHDPRLALDGGPDGLAAYGAIADEANRLLLPGGLLVVEIGIGQGEPVSALFTKAGLGVALPGQRDLAGIERVVVAVRPKH